MGHPLSHAARRRREEAALAWSPRQAVIAPLAVAGVGLHIALQSAVGGMVLSLAGLLLAAVGYLPPVAGAVAQEIIDVLPGANALRVGIPPKTLSDY
jgi:hypothetical protein